MKKSFDELTIADDYMFCTVMQDEELCKELLSMILKNKVGKIVRLFKQASSTILKCKPPTKRTYPNECATTNAP